MSLISWLALAAYGQALPDDAPPPSEEPPAVTGEAAEPVPSPAPSPVPGVIVVPDTSNATNPRHVIIPDPEGEEGESSEIATGQRVAAGAPTLPSRKPSVPPRITRRVPRPVAGDAPVALYGRYHVVEITQAAITEDFANKMERAGRALNDDCIVVRQIFDFGPMPEDIEAPHRPAKVEIAQHRECDVGGLGKYAEETSMRLAATWGAGEGVATLELPSATVLADFVRVSPPREGEMKMPPQWLAPDTEMKHDRSTYLIIAERARRGQLPVLHLTVGDQVLHLEPDAADSSFDTAVRGAAEVP